MRVYGVIKRLMLLLWAKALLYGRGVGEGQDGGGMRGVAPAPVQGGGRHAALGAAVAVVPAVGGAGHHLVEVAEAGGCLCWGSEGRDVGVVVVMTVMVV